MPKSSGAPGSITGRVRDAFGRPIAGITVAAHANESHAPKRIAFDVSKLGPKDQMIVLELEERRMHQLSSGGTAVTDAHGKYTIGPLFPGVFTVMLGSDLEDESLTTKAVEGVRVHPKARTTADLNVIEGVPLYGLVIDGETGRPIAGAEVGCRGPASPPGLGNLPKRKTDAKGFFAFHVPPGENFLELCDAGKFSRLGRRAIDVPEKGYRRAVQLVRLVRAVNGFRRSDGIQNETGNFPLELVAELMLDDPKQWRELFNRMQDQWSDPDDIRAYEGSPRTITGVVRDPNGSPVVGVQIAVDGRISNSKTFSTAVSDQKGEFILPEMPKGAFYVELSRRGFIMQRRMIKGEAEKVDLIYRMKRDPILDDPPRAALDVIDLSPIPIADRDRFTFVDLLPRSNDLLADGPLGNGNDLNRLRRGLRKLGDQYFRIDEGMIRVGPNGVYGIPRKVEGIQVGAKANQLHLLHATWDDDRELNRVGVGDEVLEYTVHYADGAAERIPVVYGRGILDWVTDRRWDDGRLINAKIAWTGSNIVTDHLLDFQGVERSDPIRKTQIRLGTMTWKNPHPWKPIASIDIGLSKGTRLDAFLVAATLERDE